MWLEFHAWQRLESSRALDKSKPESKQSRASFDAEFNLAFARSLARNSSLLSDPESFFLKVAQSPSLVGLLVLREWLLLVAEHTDSPKQQQLAHQVITHLVQHLWKTGAKDKDDEGDEDEKNTQDFANAAKEEEEGDGDDDGSDGRILAKIIGLALLILCGLRYTSCETTARA